MHCLFTNIELAPGEKKTVVKLNGKELFCRSERIEGLLEKIRNWSGYNRRVQRANRVVAEFDIATFVASATEAQRNVLLEHFKKTALAQGIENCIKLAKMPRAQTAN